MADLSELNLELDSVNDIKIPDDLPILLNEDYILYPSMIAPMLISEPDEIQLVDEAAKADRLVGVFAPKSTIEELDEDEPITFEHLYHVGTAAVILKMLKMPDGNVRLLLHGMRRIRRMEPSGMEPYFRSRIEQIRITPPNDTETQAMEKNTLKLLKSYVEQSSLPEDILIAAHNLSHPGKLSDLIASNLALAQDEQQEILELFDPKRRLMRIQEILNREVEIVAIGSRIQSKIKSKMDRHQREFMLREQIKAMRKELGEGEDEGSEVEELREQIAKAKLPEKVLKIATKELSRLDDIPLSSPEYSVSQTYLGWIVDLPWEKKTKDTLNLKKAQKILDEDHYNLKKVKERILEYLAVIKLKKSLKGPILCLVGPPGTGKTSLGRSVARAMGRKFVRISLGGMHDEAEIRGHRRTYIGSMPGRIINAMKECGTINPVIMLDEIDKVGRDFRGDPASALLEVLDPEQNFSFTDHYMNLPYDLSHVLFLTTANMIDTIPGPLLDRMDILRLSGYTVGEKTKIARQYLIPKAIDNSGLSNKNIAFTDDGLQSLIENYTREAGVRNLERTISNVCRKVARQLAEGKRAKFRADAKNIEKQLGQKLYSHEDLSDSGIVGVATGMAWTSAGGEILNIETTATPGRGKFTLTGQLGDVMKESAQAAFTFLHSQAQTLGIEPKKFKTCDVHIHVPAGGIPKDGPSAGVAMMMAMASLFLDKPLKPNLAMTGEITLKGSVLQVGGVKDKVLGAHRSGVREIILPKSNKRDLVDVPAEIKRDLKFHFVERAEQALKVGFPKPVKPKKSKKAPLGKTLVKKKPSTKKRKPAPKKKKTTAKKRRKS